MTHPFTGPITQAVQRSRLENKQRQDAKYGSTPIEYDTIQVGQIEHFRFVARMIKDNATYCEGARTWTISVPRLEAALQQQPTYSQLNPPSLEAILEEGACRYFWSLDYDRESGVDLVVIR